MCEAMAKIKTRDPCVGEAVRDDDESRVEELRSRLDEIIEVRVYETDPRYWEGQIDRLKEGRKEVR